MVIGLGGVGSARVGPGSSAFVVFDRLIVMGRAPCCDERLALKKGPWTPDEDQKLVAYIQDHGHGNWRALPEKAGLARCGKSCRLRWTNYLRPDIKRGRFTSEEDQTIIQLHAILGNRWSAIASHLPRRTDNEIKNYWNTHLRKRLTQMGIDPVTHKVSAAGLALSPQWTPLASTRLSHISQWEIALAEAQARLSKTPPNHAYLVQDEPHPSSLFMRSWTTTSKLEEKRAPRQQSRNWNAVLGLPTEMAPLSNAIAMMTTATTAFSSWPEESFPENAPDQPKAEIQFDMPDSRCSGFSYSYDVAAAEDVYESPPEGVAIENLFSPTSILQGPDSDSCSSASGTHKYNHPDCFPTIQHHSSSFASFDAHHDDIPETFWQAAGSTLLDHHGAGAPSAAGMELMAPLCFNNGDDDHALPPFDDQSLCHGAH